MEEFFKQGDKEQEQGLDFSPLCDRQNTMVPQSQIGKLSRNIWCQIGGNIIWCQIGEAWKYRLKCCDLLTFSPHGADAPFYMFCISDVCKETKKQRMRIQASLTSLCHQRWLCVGIW